MIELRKAAFRFRNRTVVDSTDLEIAPRSFTAILGPAGSGKSALLEMMAGRLAPTSGSVALDGADVDVCSPARIERMRAVLGDPTPVDRRSVDRALDLVGARSLTGRERQTLSTGEAACYDIAHAIAQDARYVLLDEPTKHLEIERQYEVLAVLARIASVGAGIVATLRSVDLGALSQWVKYSQSDDETFFEVADFHALTTGFDKTETFDSNIAEMVLDWLAVGVDPDRSALYLQSQIPEISELHLAALDDRTGLLATTRADI